MLTVAVLGAVEARRHGELLPVPSGKTTELLAWLALDAGSWVRTDVLIEDLWAQPTGRNTLQSKVSQLRRALGDRNLVMGSGEAYTLAVEPSCVDVFRVVDLARQASTARDAADAVTALDKASKALALFRGEVLVDSGDWASPHRARLVELRMGLIEDVMAARVNLGSGGEIVGQLEALVELHPLRERLWTSLITALYRSGRQADALSAYTRVRNLLVDELGIEPGADLRALEGHVLRQNAALDGRSRGVAVPGNLPASGGTLVGRDIDVAAVASLVHEHRLVTVVGPAGVGKTRLALEVTRGLRPTGGAWLVRLDAADAFADLAQLVAQALRVTGGKQALPDRLTGSETVLLLDNCEHLVDSVSALAGSMLDVAPRLHVITTSQVALGVEGEHVHQLEPLSPDDSVALFSSRT